MTRSEHIEGENTGPNIIWHCGPTESPYAEGVAALDPQIMQIRPRPGRRAGARLFGTPMFISDDMQIEVGFVPARVDTQDSFEIL